MKLEELQAEVNKLNSLLADPQPGMFTWHGMVNDVLTRIFKGFYATAPKLGGKLSQEQVIALFMADFMTWTSDRERNGTSWMLSLEEWAQRKYNLAYEAEKLMPHTTACAGGSHVPEKLRNTPFSDEELAEVTECIGLLQHRGLSIAWIQWAKRNLKPGLTLVSMIEQICNQASPGWAPPQEEAAAPSSGILPAAPGAGGVGA